MFLSFLLLFAGFVILIKGADFLVTGASSIAKKFNISNLAIGLTIVAFGTSTPELVVSFLSAIEGRNDAAFGNILGSNNFNMLFILGVSGLIYPLVVQRNTITWEIPFSLLASLMLYLMVNDQILFGQEKDMLSRVESILLLLLFGLFLIYVHRSMKRNVEYNETLSIKIYATPFATGMILLGFVMLIGGGSLVVDNAVAIAEYYGLSQRLIGLTILAAGTSLPELATSAVAAYRKNTDIAIGNVIGSNIFNICFILGLTSVVTPIPYNNVMNFDFEVMTASTLLLMIFMFTFNQRKLDRWESFILLASYIGYIFFLVVQDPGST
ncbi:MAG TPA: calcium/sodium antiporter [Chryseolinea sp.]|nr:calcium/sodium antiporter [Chryseolinea sp.]